MHGAFSARTPGVGVHGVLAGIKQTLQYLTLCLPAGDGQVDSAFRTVNLWVRKRHQVDLSTCPGLPFRLPILNPHDGLLLRLLGICLHTQAAPRKTRGRHGAIICSDTSAATKLCGTKLEMHTCKSKRSLRSTLWQPHLRRNSGMTVTPQPRHSHFTVTSQSLHEEPWGIMQTALTG